MPDYFVPVDTNSVTDLHRNLIGRGIVNKLAIAEVDKNRARLLKSYSHVEKFKSDYRIPESMITRMKEMAKGEKMEWDDEQFRKSEQFLKIQLKALMARDLFDSSAYFVIINDENDLFREGLRIISNPGVYDELLNGSFSVARK